MVETITRTVVTVKGVKIQIIPKAIVRINEKSLIGMLINFKGAKIVTLHTLTDARLRKTSKIDKTIKNPYPNLKKLSVVNGIFNIDYAKCVKNQLSREHKDNDFKAVGSWGEKINNSNVLMGHTNKDGEFNLYFQFNVRNYISTVYVNNGIEIDKSDVEDFISDNSSSSRQGTDKEIIWRKYKVGSIIGLTFKKTFYEVI